MDSQRNGLVQRCRPDQILQRQACHGGQPLQSFAERYIRRADGHHQTVQALCLEHEANQRRVLLRLVRREFEAESVFAKPREDGVDGVIFALDFFKKSGLKTAVASSSKYHLIDTVLDKLGIRKYFDAVHSSEDEKFGKPMPDVFLSAAKKLGVEPEKCLVIEDSANGVLAGKRAKMTVVAVPNERDFSSKDFDIADYKIRSLNQINKIF